jgi:hypothetical protein
MINLEGIKINEHGNNDGIKYRTLSDVHMKSLGFTEKSKFWYLRKELNCGISFNLTINKYSNIGYIDILDDDILQPYNYQEVLQDINCSQFILDLHCKIQAIMLYLTTTGVIYGYKQNDYI